LGYFNWLETGMYMPRNVSSTLTPTHQ